MSDPVMASYRQQLLSAAEGDVLEIGFGTGLNLAHYGDRVQQLTTIDPNPGMNRLAQKRISNAILPVQQQQLSSEQLPMEAASFDCVVSTWTLCSIPNVEQAIVEIHRVLKPGGRFLFIEHGLSPDPKVQVWQNRLNPFQKTIADGCHLNRNIQQLIEQTFEKVQLECFNMPSMPRFAAYTYMGTATR